MPEVISAPLDGPTMVSPARQDANKSLDALISEIEGSAALTEATKPEPETSPEPPKPTAEEIAAAVPTPEKETAEQLTMARLVEREVKMAQEREALENLRRDLAQRVADIEAKYKAFEGLDPDALRTDPWGVLRRAGVDPEIAVQLHLAEKLGDKAPEELKAALRDSQRDREVRAIREELVRRDRAEQVRSYYQHVSDGALAHVKGEHKNAPTFAAVAKSDASAAHKAVMDEIVADARERASKDPDADPLSYDEAVKRVESRWSVLAKALAPAAVAAPPAQTPQKDAKQGGAPAVVTPDPKPTVSRPLAYAYWENPDKEALREAAIKEAEAEARRFGPGR